MPSPRPSGRHPGRGWEPAWFRLERREERAKSPAAPRGSHPRLDIQDGTPGALHRRACPGRGHFQTTALHRALAAGCPPAHTPVGAGRPAVHAVSSPARFPGRRCQRAHRPTLRLPTIPSTHSHTYTLRPALAPAIGLWAPSRRPAPPGLGTAPLLSRPCSSGPSEQLAVGAGPRSVPWSWPRGSQVRAGPAL